MTEKIKCFILAAGRGERLRPITDHIPKPLVPLLGKPVIQTVLERLTALSHSGIGVNMHYKKEAIGEWIRQSAYPQKIVPFPEDPVLGTGGALKNAEAFLGGCTFLVHNADIISDINLESLVASHLSSKNLATLAVHDCPGFNNVAVSSEGMIRGVGSGYALDPKRERWMAFTGIAVYSPDFLEFLPAGVSSVVDAWLKAVKAGRGIGTFDASGCYWSDIGSPASYAETILYLLRSEGESVFIHPSSSGCMDSSFDGYLVIEGGSRIEKGASLKNCIVLPGTDPVQGIYQDCIVGPGFEMRLDHFDRERSSDPDAVLIGVGGSDRRYYRVKNGDGTRVLMRSSLDDPDFERHIVYTKFFNKYGVPVPGLSDVDVENKAAVFEDLGDTSLYNWLKCPRNEKQIEGMYRKALDMLVLIHSTITSHLAECPLLGGRVFDYDHLRWETGYFIERFVRGVRSIAVQDYGALQDEFHRLALHVDSFPKSVVHRDFQSQNIMVAKEAARLIDYQGARIGPPAYDLASILWDPYYRLGDATRKDLLEYYISTMIAAGEGFSETGFRDSLLSCRLQRHMQALGAYGFLSKAKGKKYFLKHAVECLRLLKEEATLARDEFPVLYVLVQSI